MRTISHLWDTWTLVPWQLSFPSGGQAGTACFTAVYGLLRQGRAGVFNFVTIAAPQNRRDSYECAGRLLAGYPRMHPQSAVPDRCKRRHVWPFASPFRCVFATRGTAVAVSPPVGSAGSKPGRILHTRYCASSKDARRNGIMDLITRLSAFARNEEGQDLIEYALLVGLISLVAVAAIGLAGGSVNAIFQRIQTQLAAAV
jgi:pilus assembly protein Flp/PilA